jgi:nitrogen fixation protein NifX
MQKLELVAAEARGGLSGDERSRRPLVRLAVATRDGRSLNAHFNNASHFLIYDLTHRSRRLVGVIGFDEEAEPLCSTPGGAVGAKVAALSGCQLLLVTAIGAPAAARALRGGIVPVKMPGEEPIGAVLTRVQSMMTASPPRWLSDAMSSRDYLTKLDQGPRS